MFFFLSCSPINLEISPGEFSFNCTPVATPSSAGGSAPRHWGRRKLRGRFSVATEAAETKKNCTQYVTRYSSENPKNGGLLMKQTYPISVILMDLMRYRTNNLSYGGYFNKGNMMTNY